MYLNTLKPSPNAKKEKVRLGRGIGSGKGKTAGRGHKGQRARAGGYHKVGFEGGQMPIQRRSPKFGFTSYKEMITANIRLGDLSKVIDEDVTLESLKKFNVISHSIKRVKVYLSGKISKSVTLKGVKISEGAKKAILAAGGKVE